MGWFFFLLLTLFFFFCFCRVGCDGTDVLVVQPGYRNYNFDSRQVPNILEFYLLAKEFSSHFILFYLFNLFAISRTVVSFLILRIYPIRSVQKMKDSDLIFSF